MGILVLLPRDICHSEVDLRVYPVTSLRMRGYAALGIEVFQVIPPIHSQIATAKDIVTTGIRCGESVYPLLSETYRKSAVSVDICGGTGSGAIPLTKVVLKTHDDDTRRYFS